MELPPSAPSTSTKPYMLRAIYEWCTDNGYTPYIAVHVDGRAMVPPEYVRNNEIVLNISFDATSELNMGNDWIQFRARFGGVPRKIEIPVDNVLAIYARENGQGMAFPVERAAGTTVAPVAPASPGTPLVPGMPEREAPPHAPASLTAVDGDGSPGEPDPHRPGGGRPSLKIVK